MEIRKILPKIKVTGKEENSQEQTPSEPRDSKGNTKSLNNHSSKGTDFLKSYPDLSEKGEPPRQPSDGNPTPPDESPKEGKEKAREKEEVKKLVDLLISEANKLIEEEARSGFKPRSQLRPVSTSRNSLQRQSVYA